MDKIVEVILNTGAQAVAPGYGFLSENATFVELLDNHNVKFIGPRPKAIHGKLLHFLVQATKIPISVCELIQLFLLLGDFILLCCVCVCVSSISGWGWTTIWLWFWYSLAMGDKIESKKIAKRAGVSVIPGVLEEIHDPKEVVRIGRCYLIFHQFPPECFSSKFTTCFLQPMILVILLWLKPQQEEVVKECVLLG
jgi:hypothetical protein